MTWRGHRNQKGKKLPQRGREGGLKTGSVDGENEGTFMRNGKRRRHPEGGGGRSDKLH